MYLAVTTRLNRSLQQSYGLQLHLVVGNVVECVNERLVCELGQDFRSLVGVAFFGVALGDLALERDESLDVKRRSELVDDVLATVEVESESRQIDSLAQNRVLGHRVAESVLDFSEAVLFLEVLVLVDCRGLRHASVH